MPAIKYFVKHNLMHNCKYSMHIKHFLPKAVSRSPVDTHSSTEYHHTPTNRIEALFSPPQIANRLQMATHRAHDVVNREGHCDAEGEAMRVLLSAAKGGDRKSTV